MVVRLGRLWGFEVRKLSWWGMVWVFGVGGWRFNMVGVWGIVWKGIVCCVDVVIVLGSMIFVGGKEGDGDGWVSVWWFGKVREVGLWC